MRLFYPKNHFQSFQRLIGCTRITLPGVDPIAGAVQHCKKQAGAVRLHLNVDLNDERESNLKQYAHTKNRSIAGCFDCRKIGCSGFTIFELMVVIMIASTLLTIAALCIGAWMPDIQLKAAVMGLKSDMHAARTVAIEHNAFVVSEFDTVQNQYVIYIDDGAGTLTNAHNYALDPGEVTIRSVLLHPHLDMIGAQFGAVRGRFAFNSRGCTDGLAGGIYLSNKKNTYRGVTISRIGKITVKFSEDGRAWQAIN